MRTTTPRRGTAWSSALVFKPSTTTGKAALSALPWLGNATRPTRRDVSQNTFGMATSFSRAQTNEMSLSDKL